MLASSCLFTYPAHGDSVDAAASSHQTSLHFCFNEKIFFSPLYLKHVLPMEACITYDRNALINIGKRSAGIGLSATDLDMITAYNIFWSPSQTSWI